MPSLIFIHFSPMLFSLCPQCHSYRSENTAFLGKLSMYRTSWTHSRLYYSHRKSFRKLKVNIPTWCDILFGLSNLFILTWNKKYELVRTQYFLILASSDTKIGGENPVKVCQSSILSPEILPQSSTWRHDISCRAWMLNLTAKYSMDHGSFLMTQPQRCPESAPQTEGQGGPLILLLAIIQVRG